MAKIKFYLKTPNLNESAIYARFTYGEPSFVNGEKVNHLFKYYISKTINPAFWNVKTSRASKTAKFPQNPEFNIYLNYVETTIDKTLLYFETKGITPTKDKLRVELDRILKPNKINVIDPNEIPRDFIPFIEHFIKTTSRKPNTIKSYITLKNNLLAYQNHRNITLSFDKIDIDFYNDFIDYLTKPTNSKTKLGKTATKAGLSKNTIGTRIKILKTFLAAANDRGIIVPSDYTKKSFKKPSEETFSIYLTESELMQMYNKSDMPKYLENVKDLFLIGCYTGLRFSDLSKLKKENITSDGTISIKAEKTEKTVVVPIHPIVRQIFEKYNYQLPKIPANQNFNDYIKIVAERAKINELVTIERSKGIFVVGQTTEKYKLVTSHTARRSFATNAFLADMPSISIMKITGHKTEAAFMRYIKMSAKDNAIKMQSHKFFNQMLIAK
jgi:integrase